MASGLAKKTGVASTAGSNRVCSNRRCEKNKYSHGNPLIEDWVSSKEPICYECGQEGK